MSSFDDQYLYSLSRADDRQDTANTYIKQTIKSAEIKRAKSVVGSFIQFANNLCINKELIRPVRL